MKKYIFKVKRSLFITICVFSVMHLTSLNAQNYKNPKLPVNVRVEDLIKRMTVEEKTAQLSSIVFWDDATRFYNYKGEINKEKSLKYIKNGIGHMYITIGDINITAKEYAQLSNKLQKHIIENNRLGIPVIFDNEGLHGLMTPDATIFPQAVAMSCSWDTALVKNVFSTIAKEARTRGVGQIFSPMLDVVRDPRWGRVEESYGEDPFLVSCFGVNIINAFQGNRKLLSADEPFDSQHLAATVKHFAGYGQTEGGLNMAPNLLSERYFRETFLPPFKAAVKEAKVASVMAAYNEIDGVPCHVSKWLLDDILRKDWSFDGELVSDYEGITKLYRFQHIAEGPEEAARMALQAGVDVDLPSGENYSTLTQQVKKGQIAESLLDISVRRVLRLKFLLGLFDNPYVNVDIAAKNGVTEQSRKLSLNIAQKSVVLLKNENNTLPIDKSKIKKIAVIGPLANRVLYGGYSIRTTSGITLLEGIKNKVGTSVEVTYAEGCRIQEGSDFWLDHNATLPNTKLDSALISDALKIAQTSDLIILNVGETPAMVGEHSGSTTSLELVGNQNALAKALVALNKPMVAVLTNGRPLSINFLNDHVPAILESWFLGEETGTALANIIFGDISPSGKLTRTFPISVGQIPCYYSKKPFDQDTNSYIFSSTKPLYPFGFGLSYTSFSYSNLSVLKATSGNNGSVLVSVAVKNSGKYDGDEIVQLYIHNKVSSVTRPIMELKGFRKITLKAGESQTVKFTLTSDDLAFYNQDMHWVTEPGEFEIMVGTSSASYLKKTFKLEAQ